VARYTASQLIEQFIKTAGVQEDIRTTDVRVQ